MGQRGSYQQDIENREVCADPTRRKRKKGAGSSKKQGSRKRTKSYLTVDKNEGQYGKNLPLPGK